MAGFDCEGGRGKGAAAFVARALRAKGYWNVFTFVPSVRDCPEPIVVRPREWDRKGRLDDGTEYGLERVRVYVCMDDQTDADSTIVAVERDLHTAIWASFIASEGIRLVHIDMDAETDLGRDGSGRWVRSVDVLCTVVVPGVEAE